MLCVLKLPAFSQSKATIKEVIKGCKENYFKLKKKSLPLFTKQCKSPDTGSFVAVNSEK